MVATNLTTDVASAMTTSQQRRRTYNHHADRAPQSATFELEPFLPYRLNVRTATVSEALAWIYYFRFGEITAQAISSHAMMHKTKVSRVVTVLAAREVIERRALERTSVNLFCVCCPKANASIETSFRAHWRSRRSLKRCYRQLTGVHLTLCC